jgi:hypothetical protein
MAYPSDNPRPLTSPLLLRGGYEVASISDTLQLDDSSSQILAINALLTDREVRMPASNREGVAYMVINTGGANNLLLRTSTGGNVDGFGPASATNQLGPGERALVVNIGGTWGHLGVDAVTL